MLHQADHWHMDGTFKSAPKGFAQVYTSYDHHKGNYSIFSLIINHTKIFRRNLYKNISFKGTVTPCAYCLLGRKVQESYIEILEKLLRF
jgi:hypothetical protein